MYSIKGRNQLHSTWSEYRLLVELAASERQMEKVILAKLVGIKGILRRNWGEGGGRYEKITNLANQNRFCDV